MSSPSLKPVSFGSADVFKSSFPQRFKPKQGEGYRLMLPEIDCAFMARVHYLEPSYVFCLAENNINKPCPACEAGVRGNFRYGMNVVLYKTDSNGKLREVARDVEGKEVMSYDWEVKLWLFSQGVANELYNIRSNWNLMEHDVKLLCTSEKPPKYSIQVAPESVYKSKEELRPLIIAALKSGRRDPVKEMAIYQNEADMTQAILAGAGKEKKSDFAPKNQNKPFPQAAIASSAFGSPSIIAPAAGTNAADKKLADEVVRAPEESSREISNDAEFDELLNKIRQGNKK